ncbi:MAG TPA: PqqD family protein [Gaiellaceae bacterium]|nr:PqqD family protein [Gaiellaceae bacterium]
MSSTLRRNPDVVSRELATGEVVLLDVTSGRYLGLNPAGGVIWELIDGSRTECDVCDAFRDLVEDTPEDVDDVVSRFLQSMREQGLLAR